MNILFSDRQVMKWIVLEPYSSQCLKVYLTKRVNYMQLPCRYLITKAGYRLLYCHHLCKKHALKQKELLPESAMGYHKWGSTLLQFNDLYYDLVDFNTIASCVMLVDIRPSKNLSITRHTLIMILKLTGKAS